MSKLKCQYSLDTQVKVLKSHADVYTPLDDLAIVSTNGVIHNKCGEYLWRILVSYFNELQYIGETQKKELITRGTFFL